MSKIVYTASLECTVLCCNNVESNIKFKVMSCQTICSSKKIITFCSLYFDVFLNLSTALPSAVFYEMEDATCKIIICHASSFNLFAAKPPKHLADSLPCHSYCFCVVSNYKEATTRKAPRLQCVESRDV